ncbi:aminotransferase class V-fold PLP-dependent enzyme [Roseibacterium beibuensis]|uniref:Aminotransferase class V-fold PLP-dependent enzyme n=1 Tax=[Roseibacterium] beibuensis TaxID=1193142 RepID=A0ABP9LEV1_9RHOB|nr:aminotransferase class V-fold PLP-dependent enzyme [Roseibacterium beibuensis]MCS6623593.1 aminotransferase class V-fold PLP-dependent enzyme [Roseibacterium beibuensis]
MQVYSEHFAQGDGVWLNTAHQGRLPNRSADAARQAITWKQDPIKLTSERFAGVPNRLRQAISRLLNAPPEEIVLANSASYGLHLIANAFPWTEGDEIVVMKTDFPSDILPWLNLEKRYGVRVRQVTPQGRVLSPDELREAITPRTKLFCTTWVHSFSGFGIDLDALGEACRSAGVIFVVNGSQAIGARPINVSNHPIDALTTVGFKWLCGPYGTGFCWLSQTLRDRLERTKAYWLSELTADDLAGDLGDLNVGPIQRASDLDVFGTANFFNFTAFTESIELLLEIGLERVETHNQELIEATLDGVQGAGLQAVSPVEASPARSSLALFATEDEKRMELLRSRLAEARVHVAMRAGAMRISPHFYNSQSDIERVASLIRNAMV